MNAPHLQVSSEGGRIEIAGRLDLTSFRRLLATIHQTVADKGFGEVTLDFSDATRAYPGPMLAVLATCVRLHDESDVDFFLVRPNDRKLRRLFSNANWAHIVSPQRFAPSSWQPTSVMPARWFTSPDEQHQIVDRIIDAVLSSPAELTRSSLAAFEWAVNEITDNVLQHAGSPQGGLVQLNHYPNAHWLEFAVADAGKGIPDTIRTTRSGLTDPQALELSVRQGITRDKEVGQGNGLFGTFQASRVGEGDFTIHSGYASIGSDMEAKAERVPVNGTLVVVRLDYSNPEALWHALDMRGRRGDPAGDYVELRYEHATEDSLDFVVQREAGSVGSRSAGRSARMKLEKLLAMYPAYRVRVDFADVPVISSSFADEFIGKLFVRTGALRFMRTIQFRGASPKVQSVLDRAILQRVRQEADDG